MTIKGVVNPDLASYLESATPNLVICKIVRTNIRNAAVSAVFLTASEGAVKAYQDLHKIIRNAALWAVKIPPGWRRYVINA